MLLSNKIKITNETSKLIIVVIKAILFSNFFTAKYLLIVIKKIPNKGVNNNKSNIIFIFYKF